MAQTRQATSACIARLERRWQAGRFLCVGLDTDLARLPRPFADYPSAAEAVIAFNRAIIDATHDLVCAFKPNSAYYEALGADYWPALAGTIAHIKEHYPDIPIILDAKRGDIGSTNEGYVRQIFDLLGVDAATVHPYFGREALAPFLDRRDKGIIVMASNSNPGAGEFQDEPVGPEGGPLYLHVARTVAARWNRHGNCMVTVGATYPEKMRRLRAAVGDLPLLVLGVGTQGGSLAETVRYARDSRGGGIIINASRSILYASGGDDFQQAARDAAAAFHRELTELSPGPPPCGFPFEAADLDLSPPGRDDTSPRRTPVTQRRTRI